MVGDFNGDGEQDLAVPNGFWESVDLITRLSGGLNHPPERLPAKVVHLSE